MMQPRRAAREIALVILFAADAMRIESPETALSLARILRDDEEIMNDLFGEHAQDYRVSMFSGSELWDFAERLIAGSLSNAKIIDDLITRCSHNWKLVRMSRVDRNIMRLATYELAFEGDNGQGKRRNKDGGFDGVPVKATLNEAIEIAKRYGTEESGKFVNGILDRIAQELERKAKEPAKK